MDRFDSFVPPSALLLLLLLLLLLCCDLTAACVPGRHFSILSASLALNHGAIYTNTIVLFREKGRQEDHGWKVSIDKHHHICNDSSINSSINSSI